MKFAIAATFAATCIAGCEKPTQASTQVELKQEMKTGQKMENVRPLIEGVLAEAISAIRRENVKVFTFAFYHDHESHAVSVCVDTEESSRRLVLSSNAFNHKYFWPAIEKGDLEDAALWTANTGRSLSLGDFAFVNLARTDLPRGEVTSDLYLEMIRALRAKEDEIVALAASPDSLLFCASGPDDEVAFTWAAQPQK